MVHRCIGLSVLVAGSCPALAGGPNDDVASALETAAVALNLGRPETALRAIEAVADEEPDNPWLAYYRAAAFLQLDTPYAAMESLDRAANLIHAARQRDETLLRRIEALRREARRRVLSVSLRLGVAYDSNVAFLGEGAVTTDLVTGDEDGLFESRFAVAFAPVAERDASITIGASAVNSWHFDIDEYDVQEYATYIQLSRSLGPRSEIFLGLRAAAYHLGNESYLNAAAGTLGWRYEWQERDASWRLLDATVQASTEYQDFRFAVDDGLDQDGWAPSFGIVQRFAFSPTRDPNERITGRAGYVFRQYDTDGSEYDRDTHRLHFGLDMPVKNPFRPDEYLLLPGKPLWLEFTYDWEFSRHDNESVFTRRGDKRRDRTSTYGLTLSQVLVDRPERELILHVIAQYTDANSNIRFPDRSSPFTFDKYVFGVQFEWSW